MMMIDIRKEWGGGVSQQQLGVVVAVKGDVALDRPFK